MRERSKRRAPGAAELPAPHGAMRSLVLGLVLWLVLRVPEDDADEAGGGKLGERNARAVLVVVRLTALLGILHFLAAADLLEELRVVDRDPAELVDRDPGG